jgi:hypothetical protein
LERGFARPPQSDAEADSDIENYAETVIELQRQQSGDRSERDGSTFAVGGHVLLTTVTEHGVQSRVLRRYDDQVGEVIEEDQGKPAGLAGLASRPRDIRRSNPRRPEPTPAGADGKENRKRKTLNAHDVANVIRWSKRWWFARIGFLWRQPADQFWHGFVSGRHPGR